MAVMSIIAQAWLDGLVRTDVLLVGVVAGILICACIAGWIWVHMTPGNDHPLTEQEIKNRIDQAWG
ncbi:MAG TPA: hypothetical protein DHV25_02590 [Candidatus Kerfeldbacteria bacterium]|nr:hypothetical protein [Candidatus Kerfeldbacteria bacterium]